MTLSDNHNLTCIINNVAPAKQLIVKWFKNEINIHNKTFNSASIGPENIKSGIQIVPSREDRGAVYRCEAYLDLGPDALRPNASKEFAITVHCK